MTYSETNSFRDQRGNAVKVGDFISNMSLCGERFGQVLSIKRRSSPHDVGGFDWWILTKVVDRSTERPRTKVGGLTYPYRIRLANAHISAEDKEILRTVTPYHTADLD